VKTRSRKRGGNVRGRGDWKKGIPNRVVLLTQRLLSASKTWGGNNAKKDIGEKRKKGKNQGLVKKGVPQGHQQDQGERGLLNTLDPKKPERGNGKKKKHLRGRR